jgi:hypothetical protein
MKLFYLIPKPLLFGLLGGLGCVLGWLAGEPLLSLLKSKAAGEQAAGHSAVLLFNNEFVERQTREGAKSGDVQLTLIWNNENDLDLHCIDPNGEHIYYGHTNSAAGGQLDVDMNAHSPFSRKPVENIYFPSNGAPLGHYKVLVHHYSGHAGGSDPTAYTVGVKANGTVREFNGSISHDDPTNLVYEFDVKPAPATTLIHTAFATKADWKSTAVIGAWTALLAIALSFMLVLGQNALMRRKLMSGAAAWRLLSGGLLAGLISGAISQYLFSAGAQVLSVGASNLSWLLKFGQVAGWMVLGALLGWGVAIFIPNLPKFKSSMAGLAGGLLGALAFLYGMRQMGEVEGRMLGAAILGFSIGSIVALVESLAREAALIVHWDENERTVINLGPTPVVLGSSPEAHLYLPAEKGFPAEAAIVTFENGTVELENLMTETRHTLHNGNKLQIGTLIIEIQTDK